MNMIYIENEGALYRGPVRGVPREIWNAKEKKFVPYKGTVPKPIEWGYEIDETEARGMMGLEEEGNGKNDPALQVAH